MSSKYNNDTSLNRNEQEDQEDQTVTYKDNNKDSACYINANKNSNTKTHANTDNTGIEGLSAFLKSHATERTGRGIPPLEQWHPERDGEMDLVIKANGEWWHEGSKITRESLVALFSTVLWSEPSNHKESHDNQRDYYLKTPVEKIRIQVEDVPFLINDVNVVEKGGTQWLEFITTTGDVVYLDDEHQLMMQTYQDEQRPYIPVRFGMQGLIARNVLMYLTQIGTLSTQGDKTVLTLQSGGKTYQVMVDNDGAKHSI